MNNSKLLSPEWEEVLIDDPDLQKIVLAWRRVNINISIPESPAPADPNERWLWLWECVSSTQNIPSTIPCTTTGKGDKPVTISINSAYLVDAVKSYADEDGHSIFAFRADDTLKPIIINGKATVMPMRI